MKNIAIVCLFLTAIGMLSACGTVKGFGSDVSRAGHGIQKAAR
jgi:predicted small secreted protein